MEARSWSNQGLRLWAPDSSLRIDAPGGLSPRMTLAQFFEAWFLVVVLAKNADGGVQKYRDAVRYWVEITGDPPLELIDDYTIVRFREGLRRATFQRGLYGPKYPLSEVSQAGHLSRIGAILARTGPDLDRRRPGKELLRKPPYVEARLPEMDPKPTFDLSTAQELLDAIPRMPATTRLDALSLHLVLSAWLLLLYYLGWRTGAVRRLTWATIEQRDGHYWIQLTRRASVKTGKPRYKYLHRAAWAACDLLRRHTSGQSDLLLPCPHGDRWLTELHERLQGIAGIAEEQWLSPQVWRRTHSEQIALAGAHAARRAAQQALDHADARTTERHYVDLEPYLIQQMAVLHAPPLDAQGWLF